MAKRRGFFLPLLVLIGGLVVVPGLPVERALAESKPAGGDAPVVLVAPVASGVVERASLVGEVTAETTASVGFQAAGRIDERAVRRGQRVAAGEPLAQLDSRDLAARVDSAEAELAQAQAEARLAAQELERTRQLHERQVASRQALDQAISREQASRARVASIEARLAEARNALDYATLAAPFAGVVIELVADVGDVVAAGQPVVRLAAADGRLVEVAVPERRLADLPQVGLARLDSDGVELDATLDSVSGAAAPVSRTFAARYRLPAADERPWSLGQTAMLHFDESAPRQRVPVGAVFARGDGARVFRVVDGRVEAVTVRVRRIESDYAVIESDLPVGALVVIAGVNRLHDGQAVEPRRGDEVAAGAADEVEETAP
ncbi:efflux RND transporter periplasmic adaptor subunit [Guyparkeria halophila]|uniref:Efflux RND transporter periplasmic adaptor subunit n=1 Tax=Guyparkeria halophila TaxID=47960 RepID=A0ABZ0Z1I9_9GAMM|nr:efflux RND transporter periplasmic adaptor subunit [Guyparkeria halophila]WQH17404.1 efflux RND transporter periplasmic adaptor subunit [Guyparkeria halophila]